jgi:hypothetical protein
MSNLPKSHSALAHHYFARYLQISPDSIEDYVKYLEKNEQYDLLIPAILHLLEDESFLSGSGKSTYEYSM